MEEVQQERPIPRGSHHKKPLYMEEGPCLFEYALTKELLELQPKRTAHVQTLYGVVKRLMVKVWVSIKNKATLVYADVITGTVFLESGDCLSSDQRRVVKWGNYQALEKKDKQTGRTLLQERWNKGL